MAQAATGADGRKLLIARAAHRTILARGLQGLNLRDIARELGMTTGFLTHHFRNKAELLLFAKDLLIQDMMRGAREAAASAVGWTRLQVVCEHLLPLTAARTEAWLIFFAFLGSTVGDPALMQVEKARYRASLRFYEAEIRALVASGHLARKIDAAAEALALASFTDGLVINALFSPATGQRALQRKLLARYIDTALRRKSGGPAQRRPGSAARSRSA